MGQYGSADGEFGSFGGISIDSSGNVFVVDTDAHRIQKFDNNGTYLTKWGTSGSGNGQFNRPGGVTVDLNTNAVFVADLMNHRIQKFDNNGTYLTKWGTSGSGNGQFQYPWKLTSDSSGNVFVVDVFNYRIQKFNSSGTYLTKWGSYGTGDGHFSSYPQGGIAVGTGGHVYFADSQAHKIQEFDNAGVFVQNFINYTLTEFAIAQDLAVHGNYVYVADTGHDRVMVFDKATEEFAFSWGISGTGNGQFEGPVSIETDSQGNVYVAEAWDYARIQKFDSAGNYLLQWGAWGSGDGEFLGTPGLAVDSADNIYVLDNSNNRIQKFDSNGNYLLQWGTPGNGAGEFYLDHWVESSNGITVDSQDNVYVSDSGNARIQKFDSAGNYLLQWGSFGDGNNQFKYQRGIAADPQDNIYVLDVWASSRDMLKKFDSSGNFLSLAYGYTFGFSNGNSDNQYPQNLDIDTDGDIFAIDTGASDIKRMQYEGVLSIDYQYFDVAYFGQSFTGMLSVSDEVGVVTYSVVDGELPPGLLLDPQTGQITGTSVDPIGGTYYFTVQAIDDVATDSRQMYIQVYGDPTPQLSVDGSGLSSGIENLPYDDEIRYYNAQGPVTYSLIAGSLPPGLSLQDGDFDSVLISGIPVDSGTYTFTVRFDDGHTIVEQEMDIQIWGVSDADIGVDLRLTSGGLQPNQSVQYTLTMTNYGPEILGAQSASDFTVSIVHIPDELQFVSATPVLGMTCQQIIPSSPEMEELYGGSDGYFLACMNYMSPYTLGVGENVTMTISVLATPSITDETVVKAMAYNIGDPDYLEAYYTIENMPSGNLFDLVNNNTCVYTGVNPGSCLAAMSVSPSTLPDTDWVGESPGYYSQQLQSGKDPYAQYSIVSGALPDGISLASDGLLSGYAAIPGTYTFEVLAYENSQWTTSRQLSITVPSVPEPDPISITTTSLSDGTVGEYYSDYIYSENIDGTVSYSVVDGQLPSGLFLQTVGNYAHLYGTPTTEGQWTFTVQAQDSANTANKALTIVVRPAPVARLVITTSELSDGVVGDEYEDFVNVDNVYQSVSFSIVGGSLPAGLEFEDAGGFARIYGTPTTEGQWTFTVQAQDSANTDQKIYFISIYDRDLPDVPPAVSSEEENPPQEEVKTEDPVSGTERLGHAEGVTPVQGKKRHLSPVAERLVVFFPWLVILLLGVVAVVYTLQAVAQNRAAKRLRSDLDHQEQLVHEKKNFMALTSHYMRTPITIIKSAIELAIHDVPLEYVGAVQGALSQLEAHVGSLVDDISSDAALQQVVPPSDIAYRQSRPWSPQVLLPVSVAAVSLVMGWLLTSYYTFITQSIATRIIIGFSILLLIGILYLLSEWHKRTAFETARAEQLEMYQMSIDRARNGFISSAAESIAQPLADFEECFKNPQIAEALQKGPALKMILRAIGELRGTISKFALAGELEHKMFPPQPQTVTASMLTAPAIQKVVEAHPTVEVQSMLPAEHLYALEAPGLFAKAFENVVENAANYNISSVPVMVSQEQAGEKVAITVEDHGVGIEPGKLNALFKPFGRAEDAEDFSHQGIGMGLYLTRLILDYLGGTVSAESQPGKGTKVRLSLPQPAR